MSIEPIVNKNKTRKGKRGKKKKHNQLAGQQPDPKGYKIAKTMLGVLNNEKLTSNTNVRTQKDAIGMFLTVGLLVVTALLALYPLKVYVKSFF